MLNFRAGEFKADELSTLCVEFRRGAKDVGLVLPFFLAAAHDNGFRRHQFLECLYIAGEPCAPDLLANPKQLLVILFLN